MKQWMDKLNRNFQSNINGSKNISLEKLIPEIRIKYKNMKYSAEDISAKPFSLIVYINLYLSHLLSWWKIENNLEVKV